MAPKKKVSCNGKDQQTPPPPSPPSPALIAVQPSPLSIPELLCMILANVPAADLVPLRAVSRQWTQVIGSICNKKQTLAVGNELMTLDEQSLQKRLTVHCYSGLFEHTDEGVAGPTSGHHQFTVVPMKMLPDTKSYKARHRLYKGLSTVFPSVTELYVGAMAKDVMAHELLLWLPGTTWAPRLTRLSIESLVPGYGFDLNQSLSALSALRTLELGYNYYRDRYDRPVLSKEVLSRLHHLSIVDLLPAEQGISYHMPSTELTPARRSLWYGAKIRSRGCLDRPPPLIPELSIHTCQASFTKYGDRFASLTRLALVNFRMYREEVIELIDTLGREVSPQLRWLELGLFRRFELWERPPPEIFVVDVHIWDAFTTHRHLTDLWIRNEAFFKVDVLQEHANVLLFDYKYYHYQDGQHRCPLPVMASLERLQIKLESTSDGDGDALSDELYRGLLQTGIAPKLRSVNGRSATTEEVQ